MRARRNLGPKFQRAQKRKLGPKKKFLMGGGAIHIYFISVNLRKFFRRRPAPGFPNTGTIGLMFFSYRISIYRTSEIVRVATCNISEYHL